MRKIILKSDLALGDIVAFTAVPRELHRQYPGEFEIDVRTPFPQLWEHNPHITPIADDDPDAELIPAHYDKDAWFSVHRSNQNPVHLLHAYCQDIANSLGLPSLHPSELKGDIHLSKDEYGWRSMPHDRFNCQRYWIMCLGGGKWDFTTKWYIPEYAQKIVDYFRGRIQFVQIGRENDHWHWQPDLEGVLDLRGRTDIRQLIRVVHASCGIVCGITSAMHLAAAVPLPTWQRRPRPCVVVAGGREPRSWYGYPTHRILESVGTLPCCRDGGCWNARTVPRNDGTGSDQRLCERVVSGYPKCMAMIRPESVILEIERYLEGQGIE